MAVLVAQLAVVGQHLALPLVAAPHANVLRRRRSLADHRPSRTLLVARTPVGRPHAAYILALNVAGMSHSTGSPRRLATISSQMLVKRWQSPAGVRPQTRGLFLAQTGGTGHLLGGAMVITERLVVVGRGWVVPLTRTTARRRAERPAEGILKS